jgi:hypothetical protein
MSVFTYRKKVAVSGLIGGVVIGLLTVLAAYLFPVPADCVEDSRNPYRFRDWVEYVNGMDSRGEAGTVVLISDSQGYAGEYPAKKGYPARLEVLLNERKTGGIEHWDVLNLSIDGVTPMEYMMLTARLRMESPTWLISVSGCADYRAENFEKPFTFCRTDLPDFLTDWSLAQRLPWAFWKRHGRVEESLSSWMTRRFPLLRFRDFMWSWLDTRYPGAQKAFYAPRVSYRFWQLPGDPRTQPIPSPFPTMDNVSIDLTYDEHSTVMLSEFLSQLAQVPAQYRLVAANPLSSTMKDSTIWPWVEAFQRDLERLTQELDLPYWDMTDALPPEDFITSNHFHDRNQKRMAELLAGRIAAEMGK